MRILAITLATTALATAVPASAAVVFGNAYNNVSAAAYVQGTNGSNSQIGGDSDSTTTPDSLYSEANAATSISRRRTVQASAAASFIGQAAFVSPAQGSFTFDGQVNVAALVAGARATAYAYNGNFGYNFSVTGNSVLNFDYSLTESNPYYDEEEDYEAYAALFDNTAGTYLFSQYLSYNSAGGWSTLLNAGHSYSLYGSVYAPAFASASGVNSASAWSSDAFNFNIVSAVPEPASWAMMIGGMGMIGGAMRRRSHKVSVRFA